MDVYHSVFDQFGRITTSGAMRIVDPETNRVVQEEGTAAFVGSFPALTSVQASEHLNRCLASGKPLLNLIRTDGHLFFLIEAPFQTQGKTTLLEVLMDGSDTVLSDGFLWNTERKLICELDRLRKQTIMDDLTGLYNRRYIDECLPTDIQDCVEQKQPLSILFGDIDYYKNVNDRYGHAAGDFVLSELAGIFAQNTRKAKDWIARYGGEEFLIFLKDCDNKTAKEIAERMRIGVV
jgi:hypothetical protein